ncbi:MAG: hypothetical protein ACO3E1_04575 [Flavobacteriales bacterium]
MKNKIFTVTFFLAIALSNLFASQKMSLSMVLGDHYNIPKDSFAISIYVNEVVVKSFKGTELEHGKPHAGPFTNFKTIDIDVNESILKSTNSVKINLSITGHNTWIAIDYISFLGTTKECVEYPNYTATGVDIVRYNSFKTYEFLLPTVVPNLGVQFKNVATGEYIVLLNDPRGGGALETNANPASPSWYFYQAAGASKENVEVKRTGTTNFNWSAYPKFVAWNHAKRPGGHQAPTAPHSWYVIEVRPGVVTLQSNGGCLTVVPGETVSHLKGTGKLVVISPLKSGDKNQEWEIIYVK